jgi:large subunit ribosomal protein L18
MSRLKTTRDQKIQRKNRIKAQITGTPERPRLTVSISNRHITAQVIDDQIK